MRLGLAALLIFTSSSFAEMIGERDFSPGNSRCEDFALYIGQPYAEKIHSAVYFPEIAQDVSFFTRVVKACEIDPKIWDLTPERINDANRRAQDPSIDCADVPPPANLPPVRNQSTAACCFAYTASDLISFKIGQTVSALDVAIADNLVKKGGANISATELCNGGSIESAVTSSEARGFCSEKDFPSTDYNSSPKYKDIQASFTRLIEFQKKFDAHPSDSVNCHEIEGIVAHFFPNQNLKDLLAVVQASNVKTILANLNEKTCLDRIHPHAPLKVTEIGDTQVLHQKIHEQVGKGNIIGIEYHVAGLLNEKGLSMLQGGDSHASSIIGRRFHDGQCELLLRNSWGSECSVYREDLQKNCSGGKVWIPSGDLGRSALIKGSWID